MTNFRSRQCDDRNASAPIIRSAAAMGLRLSYATAAGRALRAKPASGS